MRKIYWYITTYIRKHGFVLIGSIILGVVVFSVLLPLYFKRISTKKKHYIGLVGEYTLNNLPEMVKKQLSAGLTKIEDDYSVSPFLAERWSVEDEGKTYRFLIKDDIFWQDGKPLTTDDINYNFQDVETIITPNDVIFKLPDQFAPFPSVVSEPLFRTGEQTYMRFFKRKTLIGIGNNRIYSYKKKGNSIEELIVENEDERFIYRFYLTEDSAIIAFKKGEIDTLFDISKEYDIFDWKSVEVASNLQTDRYLAVFFNNSHPIYTKNIRQALAYGIEKVEGESRALGPISKDSWAYLPGGKSYQKDLDRAVERLLDGIPPKKMDLELTTTSLYLRKAEQIKKEWENMGDRAVAECQESDKINNKENCGNLDIQVNLKITNFPNTQDFQMILMGQEVPVDPDQYFLWHSDQEGNFTQYKNTRIDSLLEKGRQTIDFKERKAIYQEFQQFIWEDPPAIFLRYLYSHDISRK